MTDVFVTIRGNISSRMDSNSEAKASELLSILGEIFLGTTQIMMYVTSSNH